MDNPDSLLPAEAAAEALDDRQSTVTTNPDSPALAALFRQAIEQSFNAVLLTDAEPGPHGPRIMYANPAFCRMTGYQPEELLGKTPRLLQGPLTSPKVLRELSACLRDGRHFKGSTINYRKDGSPYTVEWNISPVRNEAGTITHFVSAQQDIGDLVAAQHSAQLLANALNVAQDAIFITSPEGVIEFANQGFELVTGYSSAEALGSTPTILKSGEQGQPFYQRLWHSLRSGQTFRATVANRHKDGHLIHCEETITPVHDRHGVVTHFVSIVKDLTSRIRAEQTLPHTARWAPSPRYVGFDELLAERDILSLHCHPPPATARMERGAMRIDTGRAPLVDLSALIGYRGLDVYDEEADLFLEDCSDQQPQGDVLACLLTFPNVIITAHQALLALDPPMAIAWRHPIQRRRPTGQTRAIA